VTDSSVTGSSLADIASGRLPAVQNTTCNISLKLPGPGSWQVCAGN